ncbi:hypothetical protein E2C01_074837 [Portunus trituberculatus]|uniref:Uncharacterized protein n=1 Tax=Portunus trituberculatus TaxID=210409 RepID=A0A5B7ID98_PORTR|nr:hypothetical protein [Portunus trituberculatus]
MQGEGMTVVLRYQGAGEWMEHEDNCIPPLFMTISWCHAWPDLQYGQLDAAPPAVMNGKWPVECLSSILNDCDVSISISISISEWKCGYVGRDSVKCLEGSDGNEACDECGGGVCAERGAGEEVQQVKEAAGTLHSLLSAAFAELIGLF